ncbi:MULTISPECIES: hypothetical protein [Deinococcus]|uniref:Uncharacterized protein n=2 Tax=Deinococcus TaxID=1298 RepID=A0A511MZU8_DEIC1|nr:MULTISPECIES: hypothetical protein [Deinococcus]GEM46079.1 hypothetical protein DC3_17140 [Deinococcus cellulosilyticus NBRC 106333 = KACC 11606]GGJ32871.1 hypothetical protein GCM10008938_18870 [Deinococcus roseus]
MLIFANVALEANGPIGLDVINVTHIQLLRDLGEGCLQVHLSSGRIVYLYENVDHFVERANRLLRLIHTDTGITLMKPDSL